MVVRVTWVVRLVLVIEFVNANGSHGLNNQIIEKTCDFTPVTETHTHTHGKVGQYSVWAESAILSFHILAAGCSAVSVQTSKKRNCKGADVPQNRK